MYQNNDDSEYSLVEDLARGVVVEPLLGEHFSGELKEIADEFVVGVPALVLLEQVGHEVSVSYQFEPGEAEIRITGRADFVELSSQDKIKRQDFVFGEIVLFPCGIRYEVEEQFEESPLVILLGIFAEQPLEDIDYGLNGVVQEDVGVITRDQLVTDDNQLRVIFNVSSIDCPVVGTDGQLYLLQSIAQRVLEKGSNLVFRFVEDLLQTLKERLNFLPSSIQPLLEHSDRPLLLFIPVLQLSQTPFPEQLLSNQPTNHLHFLLLRYVVLLPEQVPGLLGIHHLLKHIANLQVVFVF